MSAFPLTFPIPFNQHVSTSTKILIELHNLALQYLDILWQMTLHVARQFDFERLFSLLEHLL